MLDRVWTSVVARENIVVEIQIFCKQRTNQENIHEEGTPCSCAKEKEMATTANKLTQIHEAIHLGWNFSSPFIIIKM
jgi:hypothetical protein